LPIDIIQLGKAGGVGADAGCGLAQYGEGFVQLSGMLTHPTN
jgi:hypothetical protein